MTLTAIRDLKLAKKNGRSVHLYYWAWPIGGGRTALIESVGRKYVTVDMGGVLHRLEVKGGEGSAVKISGVYSSGLLFFEKQNMDDYFTRKRRSRELNERFEVGQEEWPGCAFALPDNWQEQGCFNQVGWPEAHHCL